MTQPKISAIVPVYNNEHTVRACLESIQAQSYECFEVIVVDDGSEDESRRVVEDICADDERFVFVSYAHRGVAAARNEGLDRAHGCFVTFLDADDVLPSDSFKCMHQATVINNADTVCGIYERVDGLTTYRNQRSYHLANKARHISRDDVDLIHSWSLCNKWLSLDLIRRHHVSFEPLRHLEDAVFLYRYLQFAQAIVTCPHIVYSYRKPLPLEGRTTTQSARMELLLDANRALSELHEITSDYGQPFADELDYRFLNAPLIGDYYRRLWETDDRFAWILTAEINNRFAGLDPEHREKLLHTQSDVLTAHGIKTKEALLSHPEIAVIVDGTEVSAATIPLLLEGLYDQAAVSFRVLVPEALADAVPARLADMPNLTRYRGDVNQAFALVIADYVAFVDEDIIYDHRSLKTMSQELRRNGDRDCVELSLTTLAGTPMNASRSGLATKLFRVAALQALGGDVREAALSLPSHHLKKPVIISVADRIASAGSQPSDTTEAGADLLDSDSGNAEDSSERERAALGGKKKRTPTAEFYLNLDVDPNLVVIEGLGKRPRGSSLYLVQELQKPAYRNVRIAFSVTKNTKSQARAIFKERGFKRVTCVVAGSDAYKRALFSAGVLFNEVDFPNWWIKKPRQTYLNIWHGTPLKKLGRAKGGVIHKDANASRNFTMADYVLCANEYSIQHILGDCDVLGLTHAKAVMLGYPRTAPLFDGDMRRRVRNRYGIDAQRVYAWMPTYREYLTGEIAQAFLNAIDALLEDDQVLYVNLHHKTAAEISYDGLRRVRPFPSECDTYEFLCGVDKLVTDYSSIMFDFAATRRKIILFCPDREDYERTRGLYRSLADLPFPVTDAPRDLVAELSTDKGYDDAAFLEEFNAYDSSENGAKLCRLALKDDASDIEIRRLDGHAQRPVFIVSDGLAPGAATDLLYDLADCGAFADNVYLSFLEQEADKHLDSVYPLVERVPLYATKGKPIGERIEEQRLYNDLNLSAVIVVDTESTKRVRCFARFDAPTYLFIQPALAECAKRDDKALKALKLFAQWGDGLFAQDETVAAEMSALLACEVSVIATADQFVKRFLDSSSKSAQSE